MVDRIVLDYTSRIAPSLLQAHAVIGVCRYLAPSSDRWKVIQPDEYRELEAAGIQVTLNWEHDARDWLGGFGAGKTHGEMAVFQARQLGYPEGRVIVGSCDFDIVRSQWERSGRAYALAFATAVRAGRYRPGVYGPWDVLEWVRTEGIMDAFWQAGMATAWSGGRNAARYPHAHLRQRAHLSIGGTDTDYNEILALPLWGAATLTKKGMSDSMYLIRRDGNSSVDIYDRGTFVVHIDNEDDLGYFQRQGVMYFNGISDAYYEALTTPLESSGEAPVVTQDQLNVAVGVWLDQHVHLS